MLAGRIVTQLKGEGRGMIWLIVIGVLLIALVDYACIVAGGDDE